MNRKEKINLSYKLGLSGLLVGLLGAAIDMLLKLNDIGTVLFYLGWVMVMLGMAFGISTFREKE